MPSVALTDDALGPTASAVAKNRDILHLSKSSFDTEPVQFALTGLASIPGRFVPGALASQHHPHFVTGAHQILVSSRCRNAGKPRTPAVAWVMLPLEDSDLQRRKQSESGKGTALGFDPRPFRHVCRFHPAKPPEPPRWGDHRGAQTARTPSTGSNHPLPRSRARTASTRARRLRGNRDAPAVTGHDCGGRERTNQLLQLDYQRRALQTSA